MAAFYADENFPTGVVEALRRFGHDVLTASEAGQANRAVTDQEVVRFASARGRTVLTLDRWDFVRLHGTDREHSGIVVCTPDPDGEGQAARIDAAVRAAGPLRGVLVRIDRPPRPTEPQALVLPEVDQVRAVFSGHVRDGKIVLDADVHLDEGTAVAIMTDSPGGFSPSNEEEAELIDAIQSVDRGEVISAAELLTRFKTDRQ